MGIKESFRRFVADRKAVLDARESPYVDFYYEGEDRFIEGRGIIIGTNLIRGKIIVKELSLDREVPSKIYAVPARNIRYPRKPEST